MMVRPKSVLLSEARRALGMSRQQMAGTIGWSFRTMVRWEGGRTDVFAPSLLKLVPLVYPVDAKLAEEIALACNTTLAHLGVGAPPPAPPPPPPPIAQHLLADSVVCAAADALKTTPDAVRPSVLASFRRARELRMTLEEVEQAMMLATGLTNEPPPPRRKGKAKDG